MSWVRLGSCFKIPLTVAIPGPVTRQHLWDGAPTFLPPTRFRHRVVMLCPGADEVQCPLTSLLWTMSTLFFVPCTSHVSSAFTKPSSPLPRLCSTTCSTFRNPSYQQLLGDFIYQLPTWMTPPKIWKPPFASSTPRGSPLPTLDTILRALLILDKYQIRCGSLQPLKSLLVSREFLKNDPIRDYSIACGWKSNEEADLVAPHSTSSDVLSCAREEVIQRMTSTEYCHILMLGKERRSKCRDYILDTRVAYTDHGCVNYAAFYGGSRSRLLESFIADRLTFYDCGGGVASSAALRSRWIWGGVRVGYH